MYTYFGTSAQARIADLEFQLQISRRMEKSNVQLIEEQYEVIMKQSVQIKNLKGTIEGMECHMDRVEEENFEETAELVEELQDLRYQKKETYEEFKKLEEKNKALAHENMNHRATLEFVRIAVARVVEQQEERDAELNRIIEHQQSLATRSNEEIENFPKDFVEQFSKLAVESESDVNIEDDLFQKELAKRMTCKICLSDVERLRCSKCLKGLCHGCHDKVPISRETLEKICPHCRNDEQRFEPIIMSRL